MAPPSDARATLRASVGARGEALVAEHLSNLGFAIVARNARVGRLEIDLIARRGDLFVFCEVRTRSHDRMMDPIATLDRNKAQRIRRAAVGWLSAQGVYAREMRFDAASVVLDDAEPRLTYFEHAF